MIEPELAPESRLGPRRAAPDAGGHSKKVLAAQSLQAFTVAVPLEVDVMTNVAVR